MSFDDITSGLQRAWNFLAPPIVRLASILTLTYYVAPVLFSRAVHAFAPFTHSTFLTNDQVKPALEFYGLSKILPVAFAILVIALLAFIDGLVLWIGNVVPPNLFSFQPALFIAATESSRIKKLWQRHRSADSLTSLRSILGARFESLDARARKSFDHWNLTRGTWHRFFSTYKFLTVWCMGIGVTATNVGAEHGKELTRAVILGLAFVACSLYAITKILYSCMQQEYAFVEAILAVEPAAFNEGDKRFITDEEIDKNLGIASHDRGRWWGVRWIDLSMVKWMWVELTWKSPTGT